MPRLIDKNRVCDMCKTEFEASVHQRHKKRRGRNIFCSHNCYRSFLSRMQTGSSNSCFRGGKTTSNGYVLINNKVGNKKQHKEHRLVMERLIGRKLTPKEVVHHIGERDDNRPHMLIAFSSQSAHIRFHANKEVLPEEIIFDGRDLIRSPERFNR